MTIVKTKTSTEVKQRWEAKTYNRYVVRIRKDTEKEIIDFVESEKSKGKGTSEIFKEAIESSIKGD